jgi:hypothetical protein
MHEKLTDIVFDQIDTQLNMMAHNLSENSTNVEGVTLVLPSGSTSIITIY